MLVKTMRTSSKDSTQVVETQRCERKTNNKSSENVRLKSIHQLHPLLK